MNRIKLRFEVVKKFWGQQRLRKEAFELTWEDSDSLRVDTLYIQVINTKNHSIFHTFLAEEKAVHTVPLRVHDDPSQYRVHAYGLKQVASLCYNVQSAASSSLDNLLTEDQDLSKLHLVSDYQYEPLQCSEQMNCNIDFHPWDHTRYVFTGFQQESHYIIVLHQMYSRNTYILLKPGGCSVYADFKAMIIPFHLPAASDFTFQSFRVTKGTERAYLGKFHSKSYKIRTHMTKVEVQELYEKAISFIGSQSVYYYLQHFYRNKAFDYFQNIMQNDHGVMRKYVKNWGGDPYSTLNRDLHGLFFSAVVDPATRSPPTKSYYGPVRLYIPTQLLLNISTNVYFSDFYCHYMRHKVQLVITLKGSISDEFCSRRLVQLNPFNNPFWKTDFVGKLMVTSDVTVEVFYTEDIPIDTWQNIFGGLSFENTETIGDSQAMVVGIPKNENCKMCNLDHVVRVRKEINTN